ncbi:MAG: SURF1 family protein [Actinobacteria bacterium]|nr:SURF1 family protein [Actinomycetota bacterium]
MTLASRRLLPLHVGVLVVLVATTLLGLWQLRRHDEARADADRLAARIDLDPIPLSEVDATGDPGSFEFVPVEATGVYEQDAEILVRNRARRGVNGWHVVTPLLLTDGGAVLVNRGWVPLDIGEAGAATAPPPEGQVTVVGPLMRSQRPSGFGPKDPDQGQLDRVFRIDVDRISRQVSAAEVFPGYLQLAAQTPPQGQGHPLPVEAPQPDAGPHLGYALQWFGLGLTAAVAYAFFLRRRLSEPEPRSELETELDR